MFRIVIISALLAACSSKYNSGKEVVDAQKAITAEKNEALVPTQQSSIHGFKVPSLTGESIDFSKFNGKKILIVNTASKCGYTPQYKELETLYEQWKQKLVIVGFPANNFGGQEPGTNEEVKEFCQKNYGVSFPMAAKVSVKGDDMAPVYQWLTQKSKNGVLDTEIKWNFGKFLLDEKGVLLQYFPSKISPLSPEITGKL